MSQTEVTAAEMMTVAMSRVLRDGETVFHGVASPLAMVAHGAQYETLWPHLVALVWQALWVVLIIRISSRMFRLTVLKSAPGGSFFSFLRRRAAEQ